MFIRVNSAKDEKEDQRRDVDNAGLGGEDSRWACRSVEPFQKL